MSPTLKQFGIDQLTVAERILLVEEIWDSIAAEEEQIPLTDAQHQEICNVVLHTMKPTRTRAAVGERSRHG